MCVKHGGALPHVGRAARRRMLEAAQWRMIWRLSLTAPHGLPDGYVARMPAPETLALAAALDRLRRRRPRWWLRVDEQSRWAAERERVSGLR